MSSLLLPELARGTTASNRQVAASVGDEVRRIEQLQAAKETWDSLQRRVTRSSREATNYVLAKVLEIAGLWQSALDGLKEGLEAGEARSVFGATLEVAESGLGLIASARSLWELARRLGVVPEKLDELDAAAREVQQIRSAIERVQTFYSRPRPPIDSERLERGKRAAKEGRVKKPEELRPTSGADGR
jgi:hypothetical protein